MSDEKYQKELFKFEEPKKPFSRFSGIFPKADFEGRVAITLTLEKLVFISIGIVMCMVIIYALGVESGKRRTAQVPFQPKQLQAVARPQVLPAKKTRAATIPGARQSMVQIPALQKNVSGKAGTPFVQVSQVARQPASTISAKTVPAPDASKPYTILAVTFSRKETAVSGAALLNKEGLNAYVVYGAPYYRVYVGAYADAYSPQSQKDLAKVRRIYRDAMFKLK